MVNYITFLRALAAMIITNAHYTGIYPTDMIANGGLLGDVIFFAVSGYCLYNIKTSFPKWYLRRILRVYPPVIIITAVYMLLGLYEFSGGLAGFVNWFIYPTYYHFVASIVLLYIPFYLVMYLVKKNEDKGGKILLSCMLGIFLVYILVYLLMYDKSTYHIDNVREPMIRFLFFEAMLLGASFRHMKGKKAAENKFINWFIMIVLACLYFASKLVFVKIEALSEFQIINQALLILLLYFVLKCFSGMEDRFSKTPKPIFSVVKYISEITLEIYVVQYVWIELLREVGAFPLNWIAVTTAIVLSASVLHFIAKGVNKITAHLFKNGE